MSIEILCLSSRALFPGLVDDSGWGAGVLPCSGAHLGDHSPFPLAWTEPLCSTGEGDSCLVWYRFPGLVWLETKVLFDIHPLHPKTLLDLPETDQINATKASEQGELLGLVSAGAASQQCCQQQEGLRAVLFTLQAAEGWKWRSGRYQADQSMWNRLMTVLNKKEL